MPNYIISLAHFCELHGPSTIVCTQASSNKDEKDDFTLQSTSKLQTCASCKLQLPNEAINLVSENDNCTFVSTQYPLHQQRYTALTKLVMKTLSVETTSDISKPVFFGDAINGYCINKIFKISDVNARGGERKYALMVVGDTESDLLGKWDSLTVYLTELITLIQNQVSSVLEESKFVKKRGSHNDLSRDDNDKDNGLFENERYLRRSMVKPKSLVELTADTKLFVKFHLWAIEVLRELMNC